MLAGGCQARVESTVSYFDQPGLWEENSPKHEQTRCRWDMWHTSWMSKHTSLSTKVSAADMVILQTRAESSAHLCS